MLVTTASPCWRAIRHSDRWPSCRLPIVGTKATRLTPARCSESSAAVWTISMRVPVVGACGVGRAARRGSPAILRSSARAPGNEPSFTAATYAASAASMLSLPGHEVADEARRRGPAGRRARRRLPAPAPSTPGPAPMPMTGMPTARVSAAPSARGTHSTTSIAAPRRPARAPSASSASAASGVLPCTR